MINRNTRQNEQEYKSESKEAIKIFKKRERVLYKPNLEQMEALQNYRIYLSIMKALQLK
jgi:hypothetical protein